MKRNPKMETAQPQTPALSDLFTILYKPRETMRGILAARHRWTIPVLVLACLCTETDDIDARAAGELLPYLNFFATAALVIFVLLAIATSWVLILFLLSWIATFVGRLLGGSGTARDVRSALAWGMTPIIWSVIYRVPLGIYKREIILPSQTRVREVILNFVAHGGCTLIVALLALQIIFALWSVIVATGNLAEAQHFSTEKGFVNLAITLALPFLVILGAAFIFGR